MNSEHVDLAARFAVPGERALPPGRHHLHREILMNHMLSQPPTRAAARPGRRRTWRGHGRLLAAVAAGTALAGGVASYVITASSAPAAPKPPTAAASPTASHSPTGSAAGSAAQQATLAAKILGDAAAHVARAAVAEPSPGQWIYYKTVDDYVASSDGQAGGVSTDEEWTTFDGSGSAYYQDGRLLTHTSTTNLPSPSLSPWAAWDADLTPKTAYDVIAALPTDPQALLMVIASHAAGMNASDAEGNPVAAEPPATEAQREFDLLSQILWNAAIGVGGPPAAEAAAYRALATLPGISVQQGITDTAGGPATGISDDGGLDHLLMNPVSSQVVGIRYLASGVAQPTIAQMLASGHLPASLRAHLATMTKAQRAQYIAVAEQAQKDPIATPRRGTLMQEIVYAKNTEVSAPGDR